jgi:thioredoxin reductase (NADPH)
VEQVDIAIIGQGYSGLTAAALAIGRGLSTANFEADCMGGLIINVNELDPVPPGAEHSGAELASALAMSNMDRGVLSVSDPVVEIARSVDGLWEVKTHSDSYLARHVIVASGARLRKLGLPNEEELYGQGVSRCADCDGPLFQGMETVIVGGGDSAFQEALTLSAYASKVTLLIRGEAPRARADLLERAAADSKLIRRTQTRVTAILGGPGKGVEGVRIESAGKGEETLPCGGVFPFIGLEPNTDFLPASLRRDRAGAVITSESGATDLPALWAIGAVRSGFGGTLMDAAKDAERVIAALGEVITCKSN